MKKSTLIQILVISFILLLASSLQMVHAQNGVGIEVPNPLEMLDVNGAIKVGTDYNNTTGAPQGGAGTIRWNGTNFEGWDGTQWVIFGSGSSNLLEDADQDTKVQVEESPDEDLIRFDVAGTEYFRMEAGRVRITNTNWNVFYGDDAGELTGTGQRNTAFGTGVLRSLVNGQYNTAIGDRPLLNLTTGNYNVGMGSRTMNYMVSGDHNIAFGRDVMWNNTSGSQNIAIGSYALYQNNGDQNVAIGVEAGNANTGSNSVFLGNAAGRNSSGSNKLYIANSNTNSPLIYGEFDNALLRVNGTLNVNNTYSFPTVDGTNGYVLATDGTGSVSWTDPNSLIDDGDWTVSGNDEYSAVSGNVGVGTSTPDAKFQVVGSSIVGFDGQTVTGSNAAIGAGYQNSVAGNNGFAAGYQNTITSGGAYSAVFGRESTASAGAAFIGGGDKAFVGSSSSAVIGGMKDTVTTGASYSVIAGGEINTISGDHSFIGGGATNDVSAPYSAAFGQGNSVTSGRSIVAGSGNTVSNVYSAAFGQNNSVGGQKSMVGGQFSHMAQGNNSQSFVWGYRDTLSGSQSAIAGGESNTISADEAFIGGGISNSVTSRGGFIGAGNSNSVSANNGAAFGQNNTAFSYSEFVVGANATEYVPTSTNGYNANDRSFVVGNGINSANRSNALTVYKNGTLNINDAYDLPNADGAGGYLMTTNGSGVVSWTDPTTISTADDGDWTINGNDQYSAVSGNVGIGATTPSELLHLRKDGSDNYIRVDAASVNSGYAGIRLAEPTYNYGWFMRFNAAPAGGLHFAFNDNSNTYDRVTIQPDGNVGIGTTSPSTALHVIPTSASGPTVTIETGSNQYPSSLVITPSTHPTSERATVRIDDWGILQDRTGTGLKDFAIYQNSTASQRFNIDVNGNVGIGDETPDTKLDVAGHIQMETGAAAGYIPVSDANGTMTWTDPTTISTADDGDWTISGNDQYSAVSGNVGIGTTTPTNLLSLGSGLGSSITDVAGKKLAIYNNAAGTDFYGLGVSSNALQFHAQSTASEAPDMVLLSDGNVGMGTTAPQHKLQLDNNGIQSGFSVDLGTTGSSIIYKDYGATTNDLHFIFEDQTNAQTEVMTVVGVGNTGYVGLGTNTPGDRLHVAGSIRMVDGNQAVGYIPVSDANGTMTWTDPSTIVSNQGWSLTGNSATTPSSNFIGTTDAQPLMIRVNGEKAGYLDLGTPFSTSFGYQALNVNTGINNAAFGYQALASNTSGRNNTAIGKGTLGANTNGNYNTAIGNALTSNTTGDSNSAVGDGALSSNTTAHSNSAFGKDALHTNTTGIFNTAVGRNTLNSNTTGNGNIAMGYNSLENNTTGQYNVSIGNWSGRNNISGSNNTYLGYSAGYGSTGSNNVFLGYSAGWQETGDNKLYIENTNSTSPLIYGEFDNDLLRINGILNINNAYSLPTVDGSSGYLMTTDGLGNVVWTDPTTITTADDGDWTVNGNDMYNSNTGNIGIGTATPDRQLNIESATGPQMLFTRNDNNTNDGEVMGELLFDNNDDTAPSSVDAAAVIRATASGNQGNSNKSGNILFMTKNNQTSSASATERMRIAANGNVGIGASSPQDELHVIGSIRMVDGNQSAGYIPVSDANGTMVWTAPASITGINELVDADGDTKIQVEESTDEDYIRFDAGGVEAMVIDNSKHVGIGGVSSGEPLHLTNTGGIQLTNSEISNTTDANGVLFFDENYYNTGEAGDGHFNGNGGGLAIKNQDGWGALVSTANMKWLDMDLNSLHVGGTSDPGNNNLVVDGNIGVGTVSPSATLDVEGDFQLVDGTQGANKVLQSDGSGNASWGLAMYQSMGNTGYQVIGNMVIAWGRVNSTTDGNQLVTYPSSWPTMSAVYHIDAQVITVDDSSGRIGFYNTTSFIYNRDDNVSGTSESLQFMVIGSL
ncbi:MAG: hypothetical protein GC178_10840 [Flavobacteriales bacterium]|nr:hypothetical protein [Flavobacteriales bacterium]